MIDQIVILLEKIMDVQKINVIKVNVIEEEKIVIMLNILEFLVK